MTPHITALSREMGRWAGEKERNERIGRDRGKKGRQGSEDDVTRSI